jgi:hypothetical protein
MAERLGLSVSESLATALRRERRLLGFEDVEAYLTWLVHNRGRLEDVTVADDGRAPESVTPEDADREPAPAGDGDERRRGGRSDAADGGPDLSVDLAPKTTRVRGGGDAVAEVAAKLSGTDDRVSALTRRAIARARHEDEAESGRERHVRLDATAFGVSAGDDRPGAELTDLDAIEVPGRREATVERRREAVGAALAYLEEVGSAKRSEFVTALYDGYPAGYDSVDGWWRCVKRGLRQVDHVDPAGPDSRVWRFRDFEGRVRVL